MPSGAGIPLAGADPVGMLAIGGESALKVEKSEGAGGAHALVRWPPPQAECRVPRFFWPSLLKRGALRLKPQ